MVTEFVVGYRLLSEVDKHGRFTTPYLDLGAVDEYAHALAIERRLNSDFRGLVETRIVNWSHV